MKLFNWFSKSNIQEIGKTISWRDSIEIIFKVNGFDSLGTIIDSRGNVKAKSIFSPYGYLIVDTPTLQGSFRLPIIHRDDFLLASSIFDDPNFSNQVKTHDLLVTYRPKTINQDGLAGIHHALHYVITPLNTLNQLTLDKVDLNIETLFIKLVWDGELRVQINPNPF